MVSPATSAALLLCVGAAGTLALAKPPGCRKLWERCAGADGQPSVEWGVGCCGGHPQADVDCLPHPDAATDGSKWGRFCQSPSGGGGQQGEPSATSEGEGSHADAAELDGGGGSNSLSKGNQTFDVREREPLLPGVYTADASAHVFNGTLYVYCSTDRPDENREDPNEMHFLMTRYTVMSFNGDLTKVTNEGEVLPLSSVKWAQKQLWAPDAMCDSDGTCYLYFPAKDRSGIFRIGAAVSSDGPLGPFVPEDSYVDRTFSVDPSVFDDDGDKWLIWGGEWGGQLENWGAGHFDAAAQRPTSGPALRPRIAKLRDTMVDIAGDVMSVRIVDDSGRDIQATDGDKKFFEAPWIHKGPSGQYYLSYSTGVTHLIVYAVAESVVGPYRYAGKIMSPPLGWTTHHSIVQYDGRTLLFYHDSATSGRTNLRQVKMQELTYGRDGRITPVSP